MKIDNLCPFLAKIAQCDEHLNAIIYDGQRFTYGDLWAAFKEQLTFLDSIKPSVIGIVGDYDIESVSFLLACIQKKHIIVPFVEHTPEDSLKCQEAQIDYLYTGGKITSIHSPVKKHTLLESLFREHKSGLILFSSGSTGRPKTMVHNLDNLLNVYLSKKTKKMNVLLFLLFDHIGGLNTLFNTLSMNACGVAIKHRKNIDLLCKTLSDYHISLLPASPSLLNLMLLSEAHKKYDLSALKVITYGTEKMPDSLLKRLKSAFPKAHFHQTFGTSEVGITQTKTKENAIKLENIDYKIINNELYLKSKTQTLGYLNADNSVFDNEGYFATGDLVEIIESNGEEYLKIIGRSKEVINVGGEKVLPQEVENILLEMSDIKDCLVYGESNAITGQSVSVKIVLSQTNALLNNIQLKKIIRMYCKDKLAAFKIPTKVEIVESLAMSERFKKLRLIGGGDNRVIFFSICSLKRANLVRGELKLCA
ncbi:long-chain fatty acid--CoA ligase [Helicobacter hepaticus]|jgi:acyl-CoA synthetase (AMP-forming)/AMP-acid ligase II